MKKRVYFLVFSCIMLLALVAFPTISWAKITINYALWGIFEPGRKPLFVDPVNEFMKENPDIEVKIVGIPYSQYNDKLTTQFEAGAGPDIFEMQDMPRVAWIKKGFLAPLDDLIPLDKFNWLKQQETAVYEGKTYSALSAFVPYPGLIYNKKMLKAAGVGIPRTPDELLKASEAIVKKKIATFGLIHPTNFANVSYLLQGGMPVIRGHCGFIVKNGKFTVNEPQFVAGVEFLRRIYASPGTPAGMQFGQQRNAYMAGKAAMVIDGAYWPTTVLGKNPKLYPDLDVALTPFPCKYNSAEINWFAIKASASPEKKKAAAKLLQVILRVKNIQRRAAEYSLPHSIKETLNILHDKYSWYEPYEIGGPWGISDLIKGYEEQTPQIRKMLADYLAKAMGGEMSPQDAMDKLQAELEAKFYKK